MESVNFEALRKKRLARMKQTMQKMGIGVLLTFDPNTICYLADVTVPFRFRWMENYFVILPVNGDIQFYGYGSCALLQNAPWLHGKIWSNTSFTRIHANTNWMDPIVDHLLNAVYEHNLEKFPVAVDGCTNALMLHDALKKQGLDLIDGRMCVNRARVIKCDEEIQCLRKSAQTSELLFRHIRELIRPGITTSEIMALSMEGLAGQNITSVIEHTIVSGPQTNPPLIGHINRRLEDGDLVHVAVNCNVYHGYKTYYYRTFCCGHARQEHIDAYEKTLLLLREGLSQIRAGQTVSDVRGIWSEFLNRWGFGRYDQSSEFFTCHGIGLATFEYPTFSSSDPGYLETFEEGMALDVYNWGGYKGGNFGIRIGENIIVTADGYELLSTYPVDKLIECGID